MRSFLIASLLVASPAFAANDGSCPVLEPSPSAVGGLLDTFTQLGRGASKAWIERSGEWGPGAVYATIDGETRKISGEGYDAWVLDGGRYVAFSGADGAGGYENEGQSLRLYDVALGKMVNGGEPVLREYYRITDVKYATDSWGNAGGILVSMQDGGLGAPHIAVVDPKRGQTWRRQMASFLGVENGVVTIGNYTADAIEADIDNPVPVSTEKFLLSKLAGRRVITNPPSHP